MAKQVINLGTAPNGAGGDDRRGAWVKAKANFTELFNWLANSSQTDDQQTALPTTLPVARGGTGAASPSAARTALGCKSAAAADIVGVVSQDAGGPTGAIIERGSNASGEYVKFADGTMICTWSGSVNYNLTNQYGANYFAVGSWSFPAQFANAPVMSGKAFLSGRLTYVASSVLSTTSWAFSVVDPNGSPASGSYLVQLSAIGRWR